MMLFAKEKGSRDKMRKEESRSAVVGDERSRKGWDGGLAVVKVWQGDGPKALHLLHHV